MSQGRLQVLIYPESCAVEGDQINDNGAGLTVVTLEPRLTEGEEVR